jgi:hypothetical protein
VQSTAGGSDTATKSEVIKKVVDIVVPVKVQLLTEVSQKIKDGEETCKVYIKGCTTAGDSKGCCDLTIENTARSISTDAIASAGTFPAFQGP